MLGYKKYKIYIIIFIAIISLGANLFLGIKLRGFKNQLNNSNVVISAKMESSIRANMLAIKDFKETSTREEIKDLQRSVQQLALLSSNWADLNQTESNPNEDLNKGLAGIESMKNTIVQHLSNQYTNQGDQLTKYDTDLLDKIYEKLERLLEIYVSIEGRSKENRNLEKVYGALNQWGSNVEEISRLYRHSRIPNEHASYISQEQILDRAENFFSDIKDFPKEKKVKDGVKIRDGVHYYEIEYFRNDELDSTLWVDAISGSLRYLEDYTLENESKNISRDEALKIAKQFIDQLGFKDEFIEEILFLKDEETKNNTYAFKFTPVLQDIAMVCDSIEIKVATKGGTVIKFNNSFNRSQVPIQEVVLERKDIEEKHEELLSNMEYSGMAIVRSFYTHYNPVVTYSYKTINKDEIRKVFFDVTTGSQVFESYSVYEPLSYMAIEGNY